MSEWIPPLPDASFPKEPGVLSAKRLANRKEKADAFCWLPHSFLNPPFCESSHFRRVRGLVVCGLTLALLLIAMLLDLREQKEDIIPALVLTASPICIAFILLWRRTAGSSYLPQYLFCGAIAFLGLHLLFMQSSPKGSLFWFILFPPMLMFFLGLTRGTIICALFFLLLSCLMLTPLDSLLAFPMTYQERYRFLLAIFGAFIFGWCSEFVRCKTQDALNRTLQHLEKEAVTDHLTELGNRRGFQAAFDWLREQNRRSGTPFSLALVDIDHFKKVNDVHGHAIGDQMLKHVAHVLLSHVRMADRVFRWGGEEFIILMPETTEHKARQAAERIRRHAEATPLICGATAIPYTVSIGLYCGNTADGQPGPDDEALQIADRNMYMAKSLGRNMVVG